MREEKTFDSLRKANIQCGIGWLGLISSVVMGFEFYNEENPDKQCIIRGVVEDYGELLFNLSSDCPDSLKKTVMKAQYASKYICEYCGRQGIIYKIGDSKKTLCPDCIKKTKRKPVNYKVDNALLDFAEKQSYSCGFGWLGIIMPVIAKMKELYELHPKWRKDTLSFRENWYRLCVNDPHLYYFKESCKAESESGHICRNCGRLGSVELMTLGSWYYVFCPECAEEQRKYDEKRIKRMFPNGIVEDEKEEDTDENYIL